MIDTKKLKYEIKRHLSDATAVTIFFTPFYAPMETMVAGVSDVISIKTRAVTSIAAYAGLANIMKLRDYSKKRFKIRKDSKRITKVLHDVTFSAAVALAVRPIIYLLAGETDWKKIAIGTAGSVGLNTGLGLLFCNFSDVYRELTGVEESERTPKFIKRRKSKFKKGLATGLLAFSLGITAVFYLFKPDVSLNLFQKQPPAQQIRPINLGELEQKIIQE